MFYGIRQDGKFYNVGSKEASETRTEFADMFELAFALTSRNSEVYSRSGSEVQCFSLVNSLNGKTLSPQAICDLCDEVLDEGCDNVLNAEDYVDVDEDLEQDREEEDNN